VSRFWGWTVFGLVCLAVTNAARADSWPGAVITEAFSESREWFVRVVPGTSVGDTVGFAGSPKGRYARAEWYRRGADRSYRFLQEITLVNPVAPVKFLVTDRGYLVTLDNWHNMGYGRVVVSYGPDARRVAGFELKDLFSTSEIQSFPTSVSSIWWRSEMAYVRDGQQSIYVGLTGQGEEFIYEPETGRWQYCNWRGREHLCRSTREDRVWRPFREPTAP
jgi:hypothetical protein